MRAAAWVGVACFVAGCVTPNGVHAYGTFFADEFSAINANLSSYYAMGFRQPQDYLLMLLAMGAFLSLGIKHSRDVFLNYDRCRSRRIGGLIMCLVRLETRRPDILDVQLQVNNTSVDLPVRSGLACRRAFAVKLLSLAAAACLLLAEPARAAERPVPTKSWRPPACITNWWQGWYLGINGAAGGYSGYRTDQDAQLNLANPVTYTQKQSGIFGGAGSSATTGRPVMVCSASRSMVTTAAWPFRQACCRTRRFRTLRLPAGSMRS